MIHVHVSGVPGVTASTLNNIIEKSECDGDYGKLLKAVAKVMSNNNCCTFEIEIFINTMMYEPADLLGHKGSHEFMFDKPEKRIFRYLDMFADKDNKIVGGPETLWCSGHSDDDNGNHLF